MLGSLSTQTGRVMVKLSNSWAAVSCLGQQCTCTRQLWQPSSSAATTPSQPNRPTFDPFTELLQSKTEQELLALMKKHQQPQAAAEDDDSEDLVDVVNHETGEVYGPRGKEPTRFGDWEIKGRCSDF
eukprot:jgi/Chrzof1/13272/Cz07g27030.t1